MYYLRPMKPLIHRYKQLENEMTFATSRSSGPGGQNVNKVNSKVELRFNVQQSNSLTDMEKQHIIVRCKNRINNDGEIIITAQVERSQLQNKEQALKKFFMLIESALKPVKKRKPTKPSRSSIEKRLKNKKLKSEIKSSRGRLF